MRNLIPWLTKCFKGEQGTVLVLVGLMLPIVVGTIGLGFETGAWYLTKRKLQTAADAAAIAGAYESTTALRRSSATSAVSSNGFGNGSNVTVTVNNPPLTGSYTTNSSAVEVILSQPQNLMFAELFLNSNPAIKVRSVALSQTSSGSACVLALATTGTGITMTGSSTLTMPTCVLVSNSTNASSINITGNNSTNVSTLYTTGNYSQGGSSTLTTATSPVTSGSATADPFSSLSMPSYSGCPNNSYNAKGTVTLSPGVYCNGLSINAKANVTLSAGTYIIDRGSLSVNGNSTVSGTDVTIVLTSSTGSSYATSSINGGAIVNLSAPTSGAYSGVAFFQDPNAPVNSSSTFNGGSTMDITGAIYMKQGALTFNGGNTTNGSCTKIVANTVSFSGNNKMKSNCSGTGMSTISPGGIVSGVKLKE